MLASMSARLALLAVIFSAATTSASLAEVTLASPFTDRAVFQREKPVPVWGRAAPREKVTVQFREQNHQVTAAPDGHWKVWLHPLPASGEPAELIVSGKRNSITVREVLVGEVWLASGQSNMEWPVSRASDGATEVAAANYPLIRELKIEHAVAPIPADEAKTTGWRAATPDQVGGFSAVAYFFARDLHRRLGVPVGIIHSSWGGTAIDAWMSDEAREATPFASAIAARWQAAKAEWPPERVASYPSDLAAWESAENDGNAKNTKNPLRWPEPPATEASPRRPAGLYNAMIAPLAPWAVSGVLWYQGESNVDYTPEYPSLFAALIRSWRAAWEEPELPFYFVQIPNYGDSEPLGRKWARLREAQATALALPATAMAVTIDLGEADNRHPLNKQDVGRRLAAIARTQVYGLPGDWSGPMFARAIREGAAMRVQFTHASTGLVAHDKPVQALEVAGADKVFHPATGRIEGETLVVSSPAVKEPVAVRYAWSNAPRANLFNGAGLPAAPFRSDDW